MKKLKWFFEETYLGRAIAYQIMFLIVFGFIFWTTDFSDELTAIILIGALIMAKDD